MCLYPLISKNESYYTNNHYLSAASTFAILMVIEEVFYVAGANAASFLYINTVDTVPTACFFHAAACYFVASLVFM